MKQKSGPDKAPAEQVMKDIRRQTRRQYSHAALSDALRHLACREEHGRAL
jgi:hypothetical protein